MTSLTGSATLTFPNGDRFDVTVDVAFTGGAAGKSGRGTFSSDAAMNIWARNDDPVLECRGTRFRVILTSADMTGSGTLVTTGAPL